MDLLYEYYSETKNLGGYCQLQPIRLGSLQNLFQINRLVMEFDKFITVPEPFEYLITMKAGRRF